MDDAIDRILSLAILISMFYKGTLIGVVAVENVAVAQKAIGINNARVFELHSRQL